MTRNKNWVRLFRLVDLFDRSLKKEQDNKAKRILEKWNPQNVPPSFDIPQQQIDEGVRRVKRNLFIELGIKNPDESDATRRIRFSRPYQYIAVAASLLLLMGISYFWINSTLQLNKNMFTSITDVTTVIQTKEQEIKQIILPDGTKLHINSESSIKYDKNQFNQKKREVWLEGEAFFEVAKNPEKPFVIHHKNLQTEVKGTSFNVRAYDELGNICVSVKTGHVEVKEGNKILADLKVNEQMMYYMAEDSVDKVIIDWNDAGAWMEKRLVLKNATIKELQLRIKQLYGKELIVSGDILVDSRFESSYEKGASFKDVMAGICQLYNVKYKEEIPNKVMVYR